MAKRTSEHRQALRKGVHKNRHLQNAFNKYGEENFKVFYSIFCPRRDLTQYEQTMVNIFRRHRKVFNNNAPVSTPMLGRKRKDSDKCRLVLDKNRDKAIAAFRHKRTNDLDFREFMRDVARGNLAKIRNNTNIENLRKSNAAKAMATDRMKAIRREAILKRFADGWVPKYNPKKTAIYNSLTDTIYASYTEAATALGVSITTIHRLVNGRDGKPPHPDWSIYEHNNV